MVHVISNSKVVKEVLKNCEGVMDLENLSPIVVFTYKRLKHTIKTIDALKENIYADKSTVYIFSDAPKSDNDEGAVNEVREYIHSIEGFKEVIVIEREINYGLADNIVSGVTEIVNKHGKIIVLEDDMVTSKYFLKYMNDALDLYEDNKDVIEISGYMYPIDNKESLPQTWFLYRYADCWGWGTWKDRWDLYEKDTKKLISSFSEEDIRFLNFNDSVNLWDQVIKNDCGALRTWAIFWHTTAYCNNKYTLVPSQSLVFNIGVDGSGENCGAVSIYDGYLLDNPVEHYPLYVEDNKAGREQIINFFNDKD